MSLLTIWLHQGDYAGSWQLFGMQRQRHTVNDSSCTLSSNIMHVRMYCKQVYSAHISGKDIRGAWPRALAEAMNVLIIYSLVCLRGQHWFWSAKHASGGDIQTTQQEVRTGGEVCFNTASCRVPNPRVSWWVTGAIWPPWENGVQEYGKCQRTCG